MDHDFDGAGAAVLDAPAHAESFAFQGRDEAAPEAQEGGGPGDEGLHELVEFSGGAQLGGNFEDLMQFLRLSASHPIELGVGNGNGAKPGQSGNQGRLLVRKWRCPPRIHEDGAVGTRGAKGGGDQNSRSFVLSQMGSAVNAGGDALSGADGALGNCNRGVQIILAVAGSNRVRQSGRFGGNGL